MALLYQVEKAAIINVILSKHRTYHMDFFDAIKKRRSIRHFTAEPVKDEDLRAMLEAARMAPNSHNAQPWHFIIIRDRDLMSRLRDIVSAAIEGQAQTGSGSEPLDPSQLQRQKFYATSVFDAPVVVLALTHPVPSPVPNTPPKADSGLQSVSAALAQLHLAATALGYGGCWSTLPLSWARWEVEAVLEVKEPWTSAAFLSIGVPAKVPRDVPKKPLEEIVTFR